jgi:murein DD-endopeptidase MepM/ murein hydrolase activator NlpD
MKLRSNKLLAAAAVLLFAIAFPLSPALAQNELPPGPIYIVQEGDTLSAIALQFGITVENLVEYNNLSDANSLFVGDRLVIPGLEDVRGILETRPVPFGEGMRSLGRRYQIPAETLRRLNRLVSPNELAVNSSLVVPIGEDEAGISRAAFPPGQTVLEYALRHQENPWTALRRNQLDSPLAVLPGDVLISSGDNEEGPGALPGFVSSMGTTSLAQGQTGEIRVQAPPGMTLEGQLGPNRLHFFWDEESDRYISLQGVYALAETGMVPLSLQITPQDGQPSAFNQYVRIRTGDFIFESISVPASLIDPQVTAQELETLLPILTTTSPEKLWQGVFAAPSRLEDCITSTFGNRRSYNGSAFTYYHAGADLCGGLGAEVLAPAPGIVLFSGLVEIRGNLTIIDHGWGVVSSYFHQSEIFVEPGDQVETGQVIGLVGSTGRSTGPHLHWELWVGGVPVDPLVWLEQQFP